MNIGYYKVYDNSYRAHYKFSILRYFRIIDYDRSNDVLKVIYGIYNIILIQYMHTHIYIYTIPIKTFTLVDNLLFISS
jgi:hypothetical protein